MARLGRCVMFSRRMRGERGGRLASGVVGGVGAGRPVQHTEPNLDIFLYGNLLSMLELYIAYILEQIPAGSVVSHVWFIWRRYMIVYDIITLRELHLLGCHLYFLLFIQIFLSDLYYFQISQYITRPALHPLWSATKHSTCPFVSRAVTSGLSRTAFIICWWSRILGTRAIFSFTFWFITFSVRLEWRQGNWIWSQTLTYVVICLLNTSIFICVNFVQDSLTCCEPW